MGRSQRSYPRLPLAMLRMWLLSMPAGARSRAAKNCSLARKLVFRTMLKAGVLAKPLTPENGKQLLPEDLETNARIQALFADMAELEQLTAMLHALYIPPDQEEAPELAHKPLPIGIVS
jgi:hypothetical protein